MATAVKVAAHALLSECHYVLLPNKYLTHCTAEQMHLYAAAAAAAERVSLCAATE